MEIRSGLGGNAFVEYDLGDGLTEVGDRLLPLRMRVVMPSQEGLPEVFLAIEVRDGVPVCRRVEVKATDTGRDVRPSDLAAIQLDSLVERVCAAVASRVVRTKEGSTTAVWEWNDTAALAEAQRTMQRARAGRPVKLTDERIQRAADIYRAHLHNRPTEAVAAAFGIAHRTATKYVSEARERGFLPPTTPGKAQA